MADHATLSPSSAGRWMTCPGSVALVATMPDRPTYNASADAGTAEHAVLEACLTFNDEAAKYIGTTPKGTSTVITEEAAKAVQSCLDYLMPYRRAGWRVRAEERMHVYKAFDGVDSETLFGTADVVGWKDHGEALILDYKGGRIPVNVEDSKQLRLYALGLMASTGWVFAQVKLVIFQPKAGGPSEVILTRSELEELVPTYQSAIDEALSHDAPLKPSEEACRWCAAAARCPEVQKQALAVAQERFMEPATLTNEQVAHVLANASRIRAALEAVESFALQQMQLGVEVPGFKLVEGKAHRRWKEGSIVNLRAMLRKLKFTAEQFSPPKLLSPAQMEKLVGRPLVGKLASYWEQPVGEPSIVPASDKRPALNPRFKALDAGSASE